MVERGAWEPGEGAPNSGWEVELLLRGNNFPPKPVVGRVKYDNITRNRMIAATGVYGESHLYLFLSSPLWGKL